MNILPHKSWHVRTKKNIARVRKDQAKAAAEEKEIQRRIALAGQEDRTRFLRERASKRLGGESNADDATERERQETSLADSLAADVNFTQSDGHINFFQSIEDGTKLDGDVNKEHEEERKKEQEDYEKKIGYLVYLGQNSLEHNKDKAWYEMIDRKNTAKESTEAKDASSSSDATLELKRTRLKEFQDPLKDIRKYLSTPGVKKASSSSTEKLAKPEKQKSIASTSNSSEPTIKPKKRKVKKEKKKHKKHKSSSHHHKNKKHKKDTSINESESEDASSEEESEEDEQQRKKETLEKLRAERLEREKQERRKAENLLKKINNPTEAEEDVKNPSNKIDTNDSRHKPLFPSVKQKYNSQFNPHLARQNFDNNR